MSVLLTARNLDKSFGVASAVPKDFHLI